MDADAVMELHSVVYKDMQKKEERRAYGDHSTSLGLHDNFQPATPTSFE